jgi:hypothetical protein
MLRILANLAAIAGLAALGLALGDFASHPNGLGAVGLMVLVVLLGIAFRQLYRLGGLASRRSAPVSREPEPPAPARRRPSTRPTSAPLWLDDDASR